METKLPDSFYTSSPFSYKRRKTVEVAVGDVALGGSNPIRIQSMTNCSTLDTEGCVKQILQLADAGCDYVRLTTPNQKEAENLRNIKQRLDSLHCRIPLIADVHFTPDVAETAAEIVEKVRINPGNYTDRKIRQQYDDMAYREALEQTAGKLLPLLKICQRNGTTLRIGCNHGSLSPRIVSRYGDTPLGMAMSALEFVEICEDFGFHQIVISMKASNVRIMTESVRLTVAMLNEKGWDYPLHLGVTEAGNGEYGRIKSTAGILPLLYDGIGDTIRVSLTENPVNEIGTARQIVQCAMEQKTEDAATQQSAVAYSPYRYQRRKGTDERFKGKTVVISQAGNLQPEDLSPQAVADIPHLSSFGCERQADTNKFEKNSINFCKYKEKNLQETAFVHDSDAGNSVLRLRHFFNCLIQNNLNQSIILHRTYHEKDWEKFRTQATGDFATLFIEGWGDGIWIENPNFPEEKIYELSLQILQACGIRFNQAEYIACPSCGRTQYEIEKVLAAIKERTSHLRNLKIGVMGCIVNGPGEMADADYGFVGCGGGKVCLYKGQKAVYKQIPQAEGIDLLIQLIKENGDWRDPA